MIVVANLDPRIPGTRFDVDSDLDRHVPMSIELLRTLPGFRIVAVGIPIGGADPVIHLNEVALAA